MADVTAVESNAATLKTLYGTGGNQMRVDDRGVEIWSEAQTLSNNDDIILDEEVTDLPLRRYPHCYGSIHLYDANGDEVVSASGGLFTLTHRTRCATQVAGGAWESPANNEVDAMAPHTVNWRGPTSAVRAAYDHNVTGTATQWRLCLIAYKN